MIDMKWHTGFCCQHICRTHSANTVNQSCLNSLRSHIHDYPILALTLLTCIGGDSVHIYNAIHECSQLWKLLKIVHGIISICRKTLFTELVNSA